jgi:hypothetical protein
VLCTETSVSSDDDNSTDATPEEFKFSPELASSSRNPATKAPTSANAVVATTRFCFARNRRISVPKFREAVRLFFDPSIVDSAMSESETEDLAGAPSIDW